MYESRALLHVSETGRTQGMVQDAHPDNGGFGALGEPLESALAQVRYIPTRDSTGKAVAAPALVTALHSAESEAIDRPHCTKTTGTGSKLRLERCYSEQERHAWRPGPSYRASQRAPSSIADYLARASTLVGD